MAPRNLKIKIGTDIDVNRLFWLHECHTTPSAGVKLFPPLL
jgi:hypothetical protein